MKICTCSFDDNMHDSHCAINGYVESDPLLPKAKEWSLKEGYVSVSYLQRILRVGYTRAARLVELLIEEGFCEEARVQVDSPRHKIVAVEQLRALDGGEVLPLHSHIFIDGHCACGRSIERHRQ